MTALSQSFSGCFPIGTFWRKPVRTRQQVQPVTASCGSKGRKRGRITGGNCPTRRAEGAGMSAKKSAGVYEKQNRIAAEVILTNRPDAARRAGFSHGPVGASGAESDRNRNRRNCSRSGGVMNSIDLPIEEVRGEAARRGGRWRGIAEDLGRLCERTRAIYRAAKALYR
jgi:hypothetical protein